MAAVAAGHLDFQMIARQLAERGEGCRQGHSPIWGERRRVAIPACQVNRGVGLARAAAAVSPPRNVVHPSPIDGLPSTEEDAMKRPTRAETAAVVGSGARQGELLAAEPWPDGFAHREEVIAPDEERALAERFALSPLTPFAFRGFLARRRVVSFGWRYDYAGQALQRSDEIPGLLMPLRERAAEFAGVPARCLQQVLVTEYAPG